MLKYIIRLGLLVYLDGADSSLEGVSARGEGGRLGRRSDNYKTCQGSYGECLGADIQVKNWGT